jgi:hypothetical protein
MLQIHKNEKNTFGKFWYTVYYKLKFEKINYYFKILTFRLFFLWIFLIQIYKIN